MLAHLPVLSVVTVPSSSSSYNEPHVPRRDAPTTLNLTFGGKRSSGWSKPSPNLLILDYWVVQYFLHHWYPRCFILWLQSKSALNLLCYRLVMKYLFEG